MLNRAFPFLLFPALLGCGERPAEEAVAGLLADPGSARFQAVEDHGSHICGEVNGRNETGGYTGYRRFVYDKPLGVALVDPRLEVADINPDPADPACGKREAYKTVAERLTCARAPDLERARRRQQAFDQSWDRLCADTQK